MSQTQSVVVLSPVRQLNLPVSNPRARWKQDNPGNGLFVFRSIYTFYCYITIVAPFIPHHVVVTSKPRSYTQRPSKNPTSTSLLFVCSQAHSGSSRPLAPLIGSSPTLSNELTWRIKGTYLLLRISITLSTWCSQRHPRFVSIFHIDRLCTESATYATASLILLHHFLARSKGCNLSHLYI